MTESRSVIIVGASNRRDRYANKAVRAYRDVGWTVYPVHPVEKVVEGIPCWPTVDSVPGRAMTMSLYVPPAVGLTVLGAAVAKGVRDVYVNPGAGSPELVERIHSLGMNPIEACSIVAMGRRPADYPE
jgi:uncharacterized protein